MTHYTTTAARTSGFNNRANTWLASMVEKIQTRRMYRKTLNGLSALNTRELNDLGLDRGNLRHVAWEAANNAR